MLPVAARWEHDNLKARLSDWISSKVGHSHLPGDVVSILENMSPDVFTQSGIGVVQGIELNELGCLLVIRNHANQVTLRLTPLGVQPASLLVQVPPPPDLVKAYSRSLALLEAQSDVTCGEKTIALPQWTIDQVAETFQAHDILHLHFCRPFMAMPLHGSCRKGIHKTSNSRLTQEQREWLEDTIFQGKRRVRDKEATTLMKKEFGGWYHTKTKRPLWLSQAQIASWISRTSKNRKAKQQTVPSTPKRAKQATGHASHRPAAGTSKDDPLSTTAETAEDEFSLLLVDPPGDDASHEVEESSF